MAVKRVPSATHRSSLSIPVDDLEMFDELTNWITENTQLSRSAYLLKAAELCARHGITDPDVADIGGEIESNTVAGVSNLTAPIDEENRSVMVDADAIAALDKLF